MTRPNAIITAVTIAVAGMLIASCFAFGVTNTFMGVLLASAAIAWSRST